MFDGWYKEEECINKWDFDIDILPDVKYDTVSEGMYAGQEREVYQETIIYAKWIKME
jgi:hypothetical protein